MTLAQQSVQNSYFSSSEALLHHIADSHRHILKIEPHHLNNLETVLQRFETHDSYLVSPTYLGLTGRRGLWVFTMMETVLVFCLHPNLKDSILVFPPLGKHPEKILGYFVDLYEHTNADIYLGRFENDITDLFPSPKKMSGGSFREIKETVLDWTFPVHTIDCLALSERRGNRYQKIRQAMNKFDSYDVSLKEIDFRSDQILLQKLAHKWEIEKNDRFENYDQKLENNYFDCLMNLGKNKNTNLDGFILNIGKKPVSFIIWEKPLSKNKTAGLFASQIADQITSHLSTYMLVKANDRIIEQGGRFFCLGGSETEGLDRFKRKFLPLQSLELQSYYLEKPQYKEIVPF